MTLEKHPCTVADLITPRSFTNQSAKYVYSLVQFIAEELTQRQPVLVVVPGDRLDSLRHALGDDADDVTMADMTEFGRNPGRIRPASTPSSNATPMSTSASSPNRPGLGEPNTSTSRICSTRRWPTSASRVRSHPTGLCPYDASCLNESLLVARPPQPSPGVAGRVAHPSEYAVDAALERCNQPLAASPAAVKHTVAQALDLAGARRSAERYGRLIRTLASACRPAVGHHRAGHQQPRSRRRSMPAGVLVRRRIRDLRVARHRSVVGPAGRATPTGRDRRRSHTDCSW